MNRPRKTTRGLTSLLLLVAIGVALGIPAVRTIWRPESHPHSWIELNGPIGEGVPCYGLGMKPTAFWPRYWRRLTGSSWKTQEFCKPIHGHVAEVCGLAHPQDFEPPDDEDSVPMFIPTRHQVALMAKLSHSPKTP